MGWDRIENQVCEHLPPRGNATPPGGAEVLGPAAPPQSDISTIEGSLGSIALQDYAAAIKEYGYDSARVEDTGFTQE